MTTTKIVLGYLISRAGLHVMPEALGEIKKFLGDPICGQIITRK